MGVPKFYRWISERYPCLSEVVREYQIPEFDNLYLDMNGIIHNCSHPNDDDVHFRITEEKIFADIFHYIEVLFRLIRPRKLFFMAVDGVAPRAKMNQQRGRRFRSAREAMKQEEEAKRKGEALPTEERFDSNCITPGTEFMVKLQEQLKYMVTKYVSTDPLWQGCQIILSGHETPGEGEHKIMEYIRYHKSQPGYNPNTRHCLYGLDADLMMLGLCTHEPHFALLREEVRFGKKSNQRASAPEETTFHLLHLSLMREYLDLEFSSLKDKLPFGYDLEHIIDDWILMGFLVGNDFIPNLPYFHIAKGALPILYKTYMSVLPTMDGYINENGKLNMPRFSKFMGKLSDIDKDYFQDVYDDLKYLKGKQSKSAGEPSTQRSNELSKFLKDKDDEVKELLGSSTEEEGSETEQDTFDMEFLQHKKAYYKEKMDGDGSAAYLRDQAESYVRAIQWNLYYYYDGVASWSWYFPHHYAPFVSDIKDFADLDLKFDLSKPFLPYQQLLGVLPAASRKLLPQAFQNLMTSQSSPILDFYPTDFETDLNGKQQDWEAVVLIPFIDEKRLIKAMEECESSLTDEEKKRNSHGPMLSYVYTSDDLGQYDAPKYFPPVMRSHAKCTKVWREELSIDQSKIVRGLCPDVRLDLYHQGFPTLKHLRFKFCLKDAKVKVFQQPSLGTSMILEIMQKEEKIDIAAISKQLIGKTVYVEWPHLVEAKVLALATTEAHYSTNPETGELKVTEMNSDLQHIWRMQECGIREKYSNRFGVKIGQTEILIYAVLLTGRTYVVTNNGLATLEKSWAKDPSPYAFQTIVRDIQVAEESAPKFMTLEELYPAGSMCFVLANEYYGSPARIIEHLKEEKGKLRVSIEVHPEPRIDGIDGNTCSEDYARGCVVAEEIGISPHPLSRITGTVYITSEERKKYNVGLNLKKKNEEVPGWTKKIDGHWCYSYETQNALAEMKKKFPEFIKYINDNTGNDMYQERQIFPKAEGRLKELVAWVSALPCHKVERQTCGTPYLGKRAIKRLEAQVAASPQGTKKYMSKVKPKILYKPSNYQGSSLPDPTTTFELYDRVINVREGLPVPQGSIGTVIGIRNWDKNMSDVVLEVLFDKEFPDGMSIRGCSPGKGYLMPSYTLISITHGSRVFDKLSRGVRQANEQPIGLAVTEPKSEDIRNQKNYKNVPPPSSFSDRPQGARQNSFNRSKSGPLSQSSPRHSRNNLPQDQQASGRTGGFEKTTILRKDVQQTENRNSPSRVSLSEAAKKLPERVNFVRGESMPGTVESTEDLNKQLQSMLNIGSTAPAPTFSQSISFEALAAGSRKTDQQQPAQVTVQALLDSARQPATKVQEPSACFQLLDVLSRMGLGVPHYHYAHIGNGMQATINLKTGAVFKGEVRINQEQAAESAARYALASLQQSPSIGQFPPPPSAHAMQHFLGQNPHFRQSQVSFPPGYPVFPFPPNPAAPLPMHGFPPQMHGFPYRSQAKSGFIPSQVQRQAPPRSQRQSERETTESEVATRSAPPALEAQRSAPTQRQNQPREQRREPRKPKLAAKFSNA